MPVNKGVREQNPPIGTSWAATPSRRAKTANRIVALARTRSFYLYIFLLRWRRYMVKSFRSNVLLINNFYLQVMTTRLILISTTTLDTSVFRNRWFGNTHGYRKQSCRSKVRWNPLIPSLQMLMTSWVALDVNWPSTRIYWTSIVPSLST